MKLLVWTIQCTREIEWVNLGSEHVSFTRILKSSISIWEVFSKDPIALHVNLWTFCIPKRLWLQARQKRRTDRESCESRVHRFWLWVSSKWIQSTTLLGRINWALETLGQKIIYSFLDRPQEIFCGLAASYWPWPAPWIQCCRSWSSDTMSSASNQIEVLLRNSDSFKLDLFAALGGLWFTNVDLERHTPHGLNDETCQKKRRRSCTDRG